MRCAGGDEPMWACDYPTFSKLTKMRNPQHSLTRPSSPSSNLTKAAARRDGIRHQGLKPPPSGKAKRLNQSTCRTFSLGTALVQARSVGRVEKKRRHRLIAVTLCLHSLSEFGRWTMRASCCMPTGSIPGDTICAHSYEFLAPAPSREISPVPAGSRLSGHRYL